MSKPLVVSIPHNLGQEEATRRIKKGLAGVRERYGSMVAITREDWTGNQLDFRVGMLGQSAEGEVTVTDADATLSIRLPWLLSRFAEKAQAVVQKQGRLMLEKK